MNILASSMREIAEQYSCFKIPYSTFERTSWSPFVELEYKRREKRTRCRNCGHIISKEMPRVYFYEAFSSFRGHYCLDCANEMLTHRASYLVHVKKELEEELKGTKELLKVVKKIKQTREYKKFLKCSRLLEKL